MAPEAFQVAGCLLRRATSPHWRSGGANYSWTNKPRNARIFPSTAEAEATAASLRLKAGSFTTVPVVVLWPPEEDEEDAG